MVAAGDIPQDLIVTGSQAAGAYYAIGKFPGGVQIAYRYIYADALRVVWYVTTGIAGMGLIASVLVRNESMDRGNNAKQAFRDTEAKETEAV
jgi:hypothetical protein